MANICVRGVLGMLIVDGMHIAASIRVEHVVEHPNHADQPHHIFSPVAGGALETLPKMPERPFVLLFDGGHLVQVDGERNVEKEAEAGEWRAPQAVRHTTRYCCHLTVHTAQARSAWSAIWCWAVGEGRAKKRPFHFFDFF